MGGNLSRSTPVVEEICSDLDNMSLQNRNEPDTQSEEQNLDANSMEQKPDANVNLEEQKVDTEEDGSAVDDQGDNSDAEDGEGEDVTNEHEGASDEEFDPNLLPAALLTGLLTAEHMLHTYSRARVYVFDKQNHEWKQRGSGRIYILERLNPDSGKLVRRVVMWNEGNMKVASNFTLLSSSQVRSDPGKPKTAIWSAMDAAHEEEGKRGTFACRFRTQEECDDFIDKCNLYCQDVQDELQSDNTEDEEESCLESSCQDEEPCNESNCQDKVACNESNCQEEDEPPSSIPDKTEKPPSESNCTGCIGCEPDDYTFPSIEVIGTIETAIECPLGSDSCSDAPDVVEPAAMLGAAK